MKKLLTFLKDMFTGTSDVSSKRINGTLCILTVLGVIITSLLFNFTIDQPKENIITTVFWGGVMLLGIGIADHYFKK